MSYPVVFTLAPCRGSPVFRAGITDYYMRSNYTSSDFNNTAERVWVSNNSMNGDELVFRINSGT